MSIIEISERNQTKLNIEQLSLSTVAEKGLPTSDFRLPTSDLQLRTFWKGYFGKGYLLQRCTSAHYSHLYT